MNPENRAEGDDEVQAAYKDFLQHEIHRPEVRQDKKLFLAAYFKAPHPLMLRPGFMIPAIGIAGILATILLWKYPAIEEKPIMLQREEVPAKIVAEPLPSSLVLPARPKPSLVEVRRATSRVGSIMVYQKRYHDVPITIIWVFPGGNST